MPMLDISELFTDPDLAGECFTFIRTFRTPTTAGTASKQYKIIKGNVGAVYPSSDKDLEILPDEERIGSFITVVSNVRLVPLTQGTGPDIILWDKSHYRVMKLSDYRHYGAGTIVAICQMIEFVLDESLLIR
jgi:hypothetical protein